MSRKAPRVKATHVFINDNAMQTSNRSIKLPAEQPLEIRQNGTVTYSLMRTPGHDIELLHGLLFDERKIQTKEDLLRASYCAGTNSAGENTYNVLDVALAQQEPHRSNNDGRSPSPTLTVVPEVKGLPSLDIIHPRYLNSCGVCGTDKIAEISPSLPQLTPTISTQQLRAATEHALSYSEAQEPIIKMSLAQVSEETPKELVSRADIHPLNATYKCTGWLMLNQPTSITGSANESRSNIMALTTAQPTFEITKALALAGIPALVSTAVPTALAVELAQETGMLLIHTPAPDRFFIFSGEITDS